MIEMSGEEVRSTTVMSSTTSIAPSRTWPEASSISVAHARGHRVAFDVALAPAADVARHVLGGEGVAVLPGDARADAERVFGRVVVGLPSSRSMPRIEPSLLYSTRYSRLPRVTLEISDQSAVRVSLSARRLICIRSVPPSALGRSACAAAGSAPIRV
jgi:hypothetical protein